MRKAGVQIVVRGDADGVYFKTAPWHACADAHKWLDLQMTAASRNRTAPKLILALPAHAAAAACLLLLLFCRNCCVVVSMLMLPLLPLACFQ